MSASSSYRAGRAVVTSLVAAPLALLCLSCAPTALQAPQAEYCAIMPDAVGLYVDNPVTQMGMAIGKVTAITPENLSVRVDFVVNQTRALPDDVQAVIRSDSLLADRAIELVGNFEGGTPLPPGGCIALGRTFTPKSLSEVIGASTEFTNAIIPDGSTNIGDVVTGVDQALRDQGTDINQLLTRTSALLDSPDQAIGDIGAIMKNLAELTSTVRAIEPTARATLEGLEQVGPDIASTVLGADKLFHGLIPLITMVADLETQLGGEVQQTLDTVSVTVRKISPRAPFYASLLNVGPRLINGLTNFAESRGNSGAAAFTIRYRPPLYRVRTPDGWAQCGYMNAAMPGSCANVAGMPYAVDVALLQYVLTQAAHR
ncbi:MlaD family protein [[Mycobacterium] burgundiense]|uniref:MlaD family protein n=1 Tax=[Mycobacterium] burgundiense TaxID=3064286 RepID=A0ABM9LKI6_9MYCO|nr:MlaD family protein [Mycolicibacterium sp. MU0053]CAJ1500508.1 MlaD family protein [Mycolicibacterium sp. MU0053]